jgi:hypothetical protein
MVRSRAYLRGLDDLAQVVVGTGAAGSADAFGWLVGSNAPDELVPDLILRVGAPLTSAAIDGLFTRPRPPELHLLAEHGLPDPLNCARSVVLGPLARTVADLRLALAAMAAPDHRDPWYVPAPLTGPPVYFPPP